MVDIFTLFDSMVAICPSDDFEVCVRYRNGTFQFQWRFDVDGDWAGYQFCAAVEALAFPEYLDFQLASASDEMMRFVNDAVFGDSAH